MTGMPRGPTRFLMAAVILTLCGDYDVMDYNKQGCVFRTCLCADVETLRIRSRQCANSRQGRGSTKNAIEPRWFCQKSVWPGLCFPEECRDVFGVGFSRSAQGKDLFQYGNDATLKSNLDYAINMYRAGLQACAG